MNIYTAMTLGRVLSFRMVSHTHGYKTNNKQQLIFSNFFCRYTNTDTESTYVITERKLK